jgi:hypothetical protein
MEDYMKFVTQLTFGTLACVFGTVLCAVLALALPIADLTLPTLTLHGMANRRSVAKYNFRTFGLWAALCGRAIFYFPWRQRLTYDLR